MQIFIFDEVGNEETFPEKQHNHLNLESQINFVEMEQTQSDNLIGNLRARASSSKILIGPPAPSSFFSSAMGGRRDLRGWSSKVRPVQALPPYILTSLGTCKEKQGKSRPL